MNAASHMSRSDLAFEHLPQPVVVADEEGRVELVNAAAQVLFGPAAATAAARREPVERALPWLAEPVRRVLAGADEVRAEVEVAVLGATRVVMARVRRLRGPVGPSGAVALVEDVTERRANDSRARFVDRLDAVGTLAAGLAHEVNNPLACVVAGLAFVAAEHARLAEALSPAELDEASAALEEAREAALRVGRVVRSLESFGRPAAPLVVPVDVTAVVRVAIKAAERGMAGRVRFVAELGPPALVCGSEVLLSEVVDALLADAAAAAQGGGDVWVSVCAGGGEVRVLVSRGSGGPPREHGLTVCHGIVGALGGTLAVESAPGGGVATTIALPLAARGGDAPGA